MVRNFRFICSSKTKAKRVRRGGGDHFLWVEGDGCRYILGIFYGWAGVGGGGWKYILGRWVSLDIFYG